MKKLPGIIGHVLGLLLIFAVTSHAQFAAPSDFLDPSSSHMQVDYATFVSKDSGLIRLEVYYQIFNRGFEFVENGGNYVADYELAIAVDDDDDNRVETISKDRQIVLAEAEKAKSRFDYRTSQVNFDLPPGKYTVRFILRDRNNDKITRKDVKVKLADDLGGESPTFSDIEFAQAFQLRGDKASVFDKGNMVVVPSVSRSYGGDDETSMAYYLEVYPGNKNDSQNVILETKISHWTRGMKYRDTLHLTLGHDVERQLREVSLKHFTPGRYDMEVTLLGRREKKLYQRKFEFEVLWTQEGMIRNDWKTTRDQLELIAESGELDGWKDLATMEERRQAFQRFWVSRDPTIGTPANEAMSEFYHRVAVANHSFAMPRREGWRTDRGHIYIRFGQPDQVDDVPFATHAVPYQVWHYYSIGRYRRFVFIDEREDGDYRLQYPYDGLNQRPDFREN